MTTTTIERSAIQESTARLTRLAAARALHGDALADATRAIAQALDAVREASRLPPRVSSVAAPVPSVRLFTFEIGAIAGADRRDLVLRAAAEAARPTCRALSEAARDEGLDELAWAVNAGDLAADDAPAGDDLRAGAGVSARALAKRLWRELEEGIFDDLVAARLSSTLDGVQRRAALLDETDAVAFDALAEAAEPLYENRIDRLSIAFTVERLPFPSEVLDPRIVRIPPGKSSEHHRHAHESLFYVVAGEGLVTVGPRRIAVRAGQCVFVPRWTMHQSHNTGDVELRILGVTDFSFTSKAQIGADGQGRFRRARAERPAQ